MSRGFVKESDQEEIPIVPPRADLPDGQINYVTPNGMQELLKERKVLQEEIKVLDDTENSDNRIARNHLIAKLNLLENRIATAKIIEPHDTSLKEIRFGAIITLKIGGQSRPKVYQIVGVDEADISKGKISFVSPLAKSLMNKRVGEQAILKLAKEERKFEILDIRYE